MQKTDFLDELAELALGSRLKRISEKLMNDASQVYKYCGIDIQPKWFTLLALIDNKQQVSVVDASQLLGLTQPAISQFSKDLVSRGLINSLPCKKDSRRKFLSLTNEGNLLVSKMRPMWKAVDLAAKQLCSEAGEQFFEAIKQFEKSLSSQTLLQRSVEILKSPNINPQIEILEFTKDLAKYFKSINTEWISEMFVLEQSDHEILNDPQSVILDQGGMVYFAKHPTFGIIGTCALLRKDSDSYELTKMGVLKRARGLKIGETLLEHVINQASKMSISNLYLLTNSDCKPAIHLYEKLGFEHDSETMSKYASKYERCDVAMRYFEK